MHPENGTGSGELSSNRSKGRIFFANVIEESMLPTSHIIFYIVGRFVVFEKVLQMIIHDDALKNRNGLKISGIQYD
jgi:hypothetical protein